MAGQDVEQALTARIRAAVDAAPPGGAFLIGLAGGVAVGKSRLAGAIAEALAPAHAVQVVAADGFLMSNGDLALAGLQGRKGFPESYDVEAFHAFLLRLATGRPAETPVYSHLTYDIVPGETRTIAGAGVVIVEGINVLQHEAARALFHLSLYLDADPDDVKGWYLSRLDDMIANEPQSLIAQIPDAALRATLIDRAWTDINLVNLRDHIAPTAAYADLVVRKGADHRLAELVVR